METLEPLYKFLETGGVVMFPLIAVSFCMWVMILYKARWLYRIRRQGLGLKEALKWLETHAKPDTKSGPGAWALEQFLGGRTFDPKADCLYWDEAVRRQVPRLWSHMSGISALAGVAPLIGLLGTVTGMIKTFRVICQFGTGNAQAMAGGISEALITTEAGLLIAIPGLFTCYILKRMLRREQQKLFRLKESVERWIKGEEVFICCA